MTPLGFSPEDEYNDLLRSGITAAKNGNHAIARKLLARAIRIRADDSRPWRWLAETTSDPDQKIECLERALSINPHDSAAKQKLLILNGKLDPEDIISPDRDFKRTQESSPVLAQSEETYLCPLCGGHIQYDIENQALMCHYCGYEKEIDKQTFSDVLEESLDMTLPTVKGHQRAQSKNRLLCQQCGGESIWVEGQKSARCPYCGSSQMITSEESDLLVAPRGIGVFKISEDDAVRRFQKWLKKGWFTPDNLINSAEKLSLTGAYYPFWTLDGTLELHWSCEVNEGNSDHPNWVPREGIEYEMFDDVLVSGNRSISEREIQEIQPFKLKELHAFDGNFLAGWSALTYNIPLAKASLAAREKVIKAVRRNLFSRVLPHKQKRGVKTGAINWLNLTYKHILLPLWVGNYRYQGKVYRILINGQTGKVNGQKPQDQVKKWIIFASILFTILVLMIFGIILAAEFKLLKIR